jgi:hypothetical protein
MRALFGVSAAHVEGIESDTAIVRIEVVVMLIYERCDLSAQPPQNILEA